MQLSMAGVKVMLAMPAHRDIPAQTVKSLLETQEALALHGIPASVQIQSGGSLVHHARTKAAWHFINSDSTHLFWVDSDIAWSAKDFLRLLAFGTKLECVSAVYPTRAEPIRFFVVGTGERFETNEYGCIPIKGCGLGFTVVQRGVIERLAERAPRLVYPDVDDGPIPRVFRCDEKDGWARGEDIAFFDDVMGLGIQPWLDPAISLGHIGAKEYRAEFSDHLVKV